MAPVPGPMGSSGRIVHERQPHLRRPRGRPCCRSARTFSSTPPDATFLSASWNRSALPGRRISPTGPPWPSPRRESSLPSWGSGSKKFRRYSISVIPGPADGLSRSPRQGATLAYPEALHLLALLRIAVLDDVLLFDRHDSGPESGHPGTVGAGAEMITPFGGPYLHALQGTTPRTLWRNRCSRRPGDRCPAPSWSVPPGRFDADRAPGFTIEPGSSSRRRERSDIRRCPDPGRSETRPASVTGYPRDEAPRAAAWSPCRHRTPLNGAYTGRVRRG